MRVIEKDKLFKYIPKPKNDIEADYYCEIADTITDLPEYIIDDEAADVQPVKRGKWVQIGKQSAKCTECGGVLKSNGIDKTGKAYIFNAVYHYCPFCGADMRGDENG